MELFHSVFDQLCEVSKMEDLEMDNDSLLLALVEEDLDEFILPRKQAELTEKQSKDCRDDFRAGANNQFSPYSLL